MEPVFYERRLDTPLFVGSLCDHPYPSHVHDVVEIACLTKGNLVMGVSGHLLTLTPHDIVIVFPNEPHSFEEVSTDAEGLAMIFEPDTFAEFHQTFRTMTPVHPLLPSQDQAPEQFQLVQSLLAIPAQQESPLRLGYMHLFLSYLFASMPLTPRRHQTRGGLSSQALQYISEHYTESLTLESTAAALGISRIHLSHLFSQQLKLPFRQYINKLRIAQACSLLWNPAYTITQIAYLCGYGNPRTFHRAFLAQCHMQPSHYRLKHAVRPTPSGDAGEEAPDPDETALLSTEFEKNR